MDKTLEKMKFRKTKHCDNRRAPPNIIKARKPNEIRGLKRIIGEYGPESLFYTEGTSYKGEYALRDRFFTLLGNPGNSSGAASVCWWPRSTMANAIVGMYPNMSVTNTYLYSSEME